MATDRCGNPIFALPPLCVRRPGRRVTRGDSSHRLVYFRRSGARNADSRSSRGPGRRYRMATNALRPLGYQDEFRSCARHRRNGFGWLYDRGPSSRTPQASEIRRSRNPVRHPRSHRHCGAFFDPGPHLGSRARLASTPSESGAYHPKKTPCSSEAMALDCIGWPGQLVDQNR